MRAVCALAFRTKSEMGNISFILRSIGMGEMVRDH
jgi:hypothetical protein